MGKHRKEVLAELALDNGWTRGAELGVYDGVTFEYLLENVSNLFLIGVDLWDSSRSGVKDKVAGTSDYSKKPMVDCREKVFRIAGRFHERSRILWDDTVSAARYVTPDSLDFVFVDADHTTEAVRNDILAWRPRLKSTGKLLGHDESWHSVQEALISLGIKWDKLPGGCWIAR